MADDKPYDGGSAFPLSGTADSYDTHGMTLRQFYAAHALVGAFQASHVPIKIATLALEVADTLIALEKGGK